MAVSSPPPENFAALALPHLDAAYNLARWLMRDPAEAEDVAQEAMLRALDYFASYRGGDARAWLLSIVRNVAYARLARRRRAMDVAPLDAEEEGVLLTETLADPADDPEVSLARRQDRARLDAMLAALPVELRECVVLRDLEELSYKDIARVTGVPVGTVMSRLWRARRVLIRAVREGAR